ncbi:MAG: O-antigen ligase family protein [Eubacteriales bacterium]|nr:O-antigen ligase family protein [Eubacteriales bacterium]MDD3880733.1 O-antigen ligase family protein [Eubacteriales bacterium]MDD4511633.1 O-antigen ligase family protein [Eubacteriales bacterium]
MAKLLNKNELSIDELPDLEKPKRRFFGREKKPEPEEKLPLTSPKSEYFRKPPKIFVIMYVFFIFAAGMGDWVQINGRFGAILKAMTVGCIALAILYFMIYGESKVLPKIYSFFVLFAIPLLLTLLISLFVWSVNMADMSAVSRGAQKMLFQFINVAAVLSGAYMFRQAALRYMFFGLALANGTMAAIEAARFGIGASIQSLVNGIISGGEAIGFMRRMEIADITFTMGLFMLYFIFIERKRKGTFKWILISGFFFLLGFKRIAFAGFAMSLVMWVVLEKRRLKTRIRTVYTVSIMLALFCFFYVIFIKSGMFIELCAQLNIDVLGRDIIYNYMSNYYEISPMFMGQGFEYTVALLQSMIRSGEKLIGVMAIHNDILKQFIELGFWGFWAWALFNYVYQIRWYMRDFGEKAGRLVLAINLYTIITYMTDNTLYYFWMSMAIRMLMISYAFSDEVKVELEKEQKERGFITPDELRDFAGDDSLV